MSISAATSAQTMNGSLPPISRFTRAVRVAARSAIRVPVATLPVNAMQSTRSSSTSRAPTSPPPASSATSPAGRWSRQGASASVDSGVSSDGLQSAALPAASTGASFQASRSSG